MIRWVALIGFLCAIGNAILANDWHGRLGWICAVWFFVLFYDW